MELIRELITGSARTRSQSTSPLNHEIMNDAMKSEAVVKGTLCFLAGLRIGKLLRAFGQANKIRDGLRRFLFKQAADNVSLRSLKNGIGSGRPCQIHLPNGSLEIEANISRRSYPSEIIKEEKSSRFVSVLF